MKIDISPSQFEEILKRGYNTDQVIMLMFIRDNLDINEISKDSERVKAIYQSLIRKGLISETEDKITLMGNELLIFVNTKDSKKLVKRKPVTTEFEQWWNAYPGTDTFSYKGHSFAGSRSLRVNKDNCHVKFDKILLEGEYTASQLIEALKYDVLQKMEMSVKLRTNKITYMQNSLTYLNQRSFEPFIELIKKHPVQKPVDEPNWTTDI